VLGLEIVEGAALLLDLDRLGSGLGLSLVLLGRISVKVLATLLAVRNAAGVSALYGACAHGVAVFEGR